MRGRRRANPKENTLFALGLQRGIRGGGSAYGRRQRKCWTTNGHESTRI